MEIPDKNIDAQKLVELLFNNYSKKMYSYATQVWKFSEDDTWNAIYETIFKVAKVYKNYDFDKIKKLTSFILTSFNNNLKNIFKEKKKDLKIVFVEDIDNQNFSNNNENSYKLSEAINIVSSVLDNLEDWERILVKLRVFDVPYKIISVYTNKPEKQLKVYYNRLRKKIKEKIIEITEVNLNK